MECGECFRHGGIDGTVIMTDLQAEASWPVKSCSRQSGESKEDQLRRVINKVSNELQDHFQIKMIPGQGVHSAKRKGKRSLSRNLFHYQEGI